MNFMQIFLAPILGVSSTSNVHKLLRHLLDAIRTQGNLQNCDTSVKVSCHERDKSYYNRTNKPSAALMGQLVLNSPENLELQRPLDKADVIAKGCTKSVLASASARLPRRRPRQAAGGLSISWRALASAP